MSNETIGASAVLNLNGLRTADGTEDILEAAHRAQLADFIRSLPNGMETLIGERGVKLSGGQKQRVAIGRMFLKNPPILILDEATSALDTETQYFTILSRSREDREASHLQLRGFAPLRAAES